MAKAVTTWTTAYIMGVTPGPWEEKEEGGGTQSEPTFREAEKKRLTGTLC